MMDLRRFWWWVVLVFVQLGMNGCFGCWEQERIALLQLKAYWIKHTDGYNFPSWNSANKESDCCEWAGVECNITTRRVIQLALNETTDYTKGAWYLNASLFLPFEELEHLDLNHNWIHGWIQNEGFERFSKLSKLEVLILSNNFFNNSILSSLSGIASLKRLDLIRNNLEGSIHIQELKALSNLEELYLNSNGIDHFTITKDLNIFSKLQYLNLNWNYFSAQVFESLAAFPSLKILDLRYNYFFEGTFLTRELAKLNLEQWYLDESPIDKSFLHKVGVMTSLKVLTVRRCGLNGTLPAQGWCELRNLQEIDLSDNEFEGQLPSCIASLVSLHLLDLSDNHFNENIAHSHISNLTSLEFLSLSHNNFSIPITFSYFSNLSNFKYLLIDNNKIALETNSHTWAPTFQLRVFDLSECLFDGVNNTIPTFLHYQYDLREIDLSHNKLVGKFPTWLLENNTRLRVLYLRNNSFTGSFLVPYHLHPNIRRIDISYNYFQGQIPIYFGLIFPNLEYLNMSKNAFQGSIPPSFGNLASLRVLDLSENHLSGTIPMLFTTGCYSLKFLKFSYNNFRGQIFSINFNLTMLSLLYLDNNQFSRITATWMGNMSSLEEFSMAKNELEGQIPMELCKLIGLRFVDLSNNNLFGYVPSCFNSSSLSFVHLNKNWLSGPISSAFKNNSNLVTLNLQDNHLTGIIPNWISSLSSLSLLLLRANNLEGKIPSQLCLLHSLNLLDLSYNKFSGPIPHCLSNITFGAFAEKIDFGKIVTKIFGNIESEARAYLKTHLGTMQNIESEVDVVDLLEANEGVEFTTKSRTYSYKGVILNYMFGIDLSYNKLVGKIPPELGSISKLQTLNLSHNNLSGPIPVTFSNLKQIESLDLSYNNLSGRIPPQLTEMTFLAVFSVAYNNLSGTIPDRKNQFITFDESTYEGNPLLCGPPLHNDCIKIGIPPTMSLDHEEEEGDSFMDMGVFYISFVVAYITMLLVIVAVLYINPYWRRAWFDLIEMCIDTCYCFVVVHYNKLFNFRLA